MARYSVKLSDSDFDALISHFRCDVYPTYSSAYYCVSRKFSPWLWRVCRGSDGSYYVFPLSALIDSGYRKEVI